MFIFNLQSNLLKFIHNQLQTYLISSEQQNQSLVDDFYNEVFNQIDQDIKGINETQIIQRKQFNDFVRTWQFDFVNMIQQKEPLKKFNWDCWTRSDNKGYGISCILQDGKYIQKAGVNITKAIFKFSKGQMETARDRGKVQKFMDQYNLTTDDLEAYVNGCSVVIHPRNPYQPTTHANFRLFQICRKSDGQTVDYWFGGGCDLTPTYLFQEDCQLFHQSQKSVCDQYQKGLHQVLKTECDKYFHIPHRQECRGVGGTFFMEMVLDQDFNKTLQFCKDSGYALLNSYKEILTRRQNYKYGSDQVEWQQLRRGRYVEFNLIYDKGTLFGMKTPNANYEAILMSLPLQSRFEYKHQLIEGSPEYQITQILRNPIDWV